MKILKNKKFILCILVLCLTQPFSLNAQHVGGNPGPCPGGSAPVDGSCGSPSNARLGSTRASEVWRDNYGALAATQNGAIVGSANNQKSFKAARKVAMKKCAEASCRVVSEYANGCGSVAWGLKSEAEGVRSYASGTTSAESDEKALKICRDGNGKGCVVEFTGCSLPVRVQ